MNTRMEIATEQHVVYFEVGQPIDVDHLFPCLDQPSSLLYQVKSVNRQTGEITIGPRIESCKEQFEEYATEGNGEDAAPLTGAAVDYMAAEFDTAFKKIANAMERDLNILDQHDHGPNSTFEIARRAKLIDSAIDQWKRTAGDVPCSVRVDGDIAYVTGIYSDADYSFDPLDWEHSPPVIEAPKFCKCTKPDPVNISIFRMMLVCKKCDKDIK